jgi:hypothetical protein
MKNIRSFKAISEALGIEFDPDNFDSLDDDGDVQPLETMAGEANPFYNLKHTDETRKLISKKIRYLYDNDHEWKLSHINYGPKNGMYESARFGELNPMWGKKQSEETKRKISEKAKGRPSKLKGRKGKKASPETRAKMSAARRGQKKSPEAKQKMSEARKLYWKNKCLALNDIP